jgi:DNA repair exonuclease SbcCD nuclease subunit
MERKHQMNGFIQCSDIHIGECRAYPDYLKRHEGILFDILNLAKTNNLPLIMAGDLFDVKNTTYEERLLAFKWMYNIELAGIDCIFIAGNHDHLYDNYTQLDLYKYCNFQKVKIFTWEPGYHVINDTFYICIPWRNYNTDQLQEIVCKLLSFRGNCKSVVVVLHECLVGSLSDSGRPLFKGTKLPIVPDVTYWAIGDIHRYQRTNLDNGWYSGAVAMFNFDDIRDKGCLQVDLDNPNAPTFIKIYSKPLIQITSIDQIQEDAYYKVVGNMDDVLKSTKNASVVKTEVKYSFEGPISYDKVTLTNGLAEFLASKGISTELQEYGISWMKKNFST